MVTLIFKLSLKSASTVLQFEKKLIPLPSTIVVISTFGIYDFWAHAKILNTRNFPLKLAKEKFGQSDMG